MWQAIFIALYVGFVLPLVSSQALKEVIVPMTVDDGETVEIHIPATFTPLAAALEICVGFARHGRLGNPDTVMFQVDDCLEAVVSYVEAARHMEVPTDVFEVGNVPMAQWARHLKHRDRSLMALKHRISGLAKDDDDDEDGAKAYLFFVHLKKCGGGTIEKNLLHVELGAERVLQTEDGERLFYHQTRADLDDWKASLVHRRVWAVAGHIPYGYHTVVSPSQNVYITMLRRPRDRLTSLHAYLKVASQWEYECDADDGPKKGQICSNRQWWPSGLPVKASIGNWLDVVSNRSQEEFVHVDNYQVRMLCGSNALLDRGWASLAMLDCAKTNLLLKFHWVGIMERMDQSVCLLRALMGWKRLRGSLPKQNFNHPSARSFPDEVPSRYVRYDEELYAFARQLFHRQLEATRECA